jgi:hypothetical protein
MTRCCSLVGALALSLLATHAVAAEEAGTAPDASSPEEAAEDQLMIRPFTAVSYVTLDLEPEKGGAVTVEPNPTSNLGVTLGAWGFTISASVGLGQVESTRDYGRSRNFDLELEHAFEVFDRRQLDLNAFLHVHETLSVARPNATRQLLPDALLTAFGLSAILTLKPGFSLAAAFSDFTPRNGSSGSWFLRSSLGLWFVGFLDDPERLLIPTELSAELGRFQSLNRLGEASLTASGGYAYDWNLFHHFFLSAMGNVGFTGARLRTFLSDSSSRSSLAYGPSLGLHVVLSYVGSTFHAGLLSTDVLESVTAHHVDVTAQRVNALLFAGVRF